MQHFNLLHHHSKKYRASLSRFIAPALTALVLVSSPSIQASESNLTPAQQEKVENAQQELKSALKLSDQQATEVSAILKKQREEVRKVFSAANLSEDQDRGELSWREKRKLMKQLRPIRKQTDQELSKVLSTEQMEAYKEYRQQKREKLKAQRSN